MYRSSQRQSLECMVQASLLLEGPGLTRAASIERVAVPANHNRVSWSTINGACTLGKIRSSATLTAPLRDPGFGPPWTSKQAATDTRTGRTSFRSDIINPTRFTIHPLLCEIAVHLSLCRVSRWRLGHHWRGARSRRQANISTSWAW